MGGQGEAPLRTGDCEAPSVRVRCVCPTETAEAERGGRSHCFRGQPPASFKALSSGHHPKCLAPSAPSGRSWRCPLPTRWRCCPTSNLLVSRRVSPFPVDCVGAARGQRRTMKEPPQHTHASPLPPGLKYQTRTSGLAALEAEASGQCSRAATAGRLFLVSTVMGPVFQGRKREPKATRLPRWTDSWIHRGHAMGAHAPKGPSFQKRTAFNN